MFANFFKSLLDGRLQRAAALHFAFALQPLKGSALVGCDVIGLVALYFVLRIVFRSMMNITLVLKILGVDGDDRPGHPTGFRIPAYVIANAEFLTHVAILPAFRAMTEPVRSGCHS